MRCSSFFAQPGLGIHARQRIKLKLLYAILLIVNSALHGGTNIFAMGAEFQRPHRKYDTGFSFDLKGVLMRKLG